MLYRSLGNQGSDDNLNILYFARSTLLINHNYVFKTQKIVYFWYVKDYFKYSFYVLI